MYVLICNNIFDGASPDFVSDDKQKLKDKMKELIKEDKEEGTNTNEYYIEYATKI